MITRNALDGHKECILRSHRVVARSLVGAIRTPLGQFSIRIGMNRVAKGSLGTRSDRPRRRATLPNAFAGRIAQQLSVGDPYTPAQRSHQGAAPSTNGSGRRFLDRFRRADGVATWLHPSGSARPVRRLQLERDCYRCRSTPCVESASCTLSRKRTFSSRSTGIPKDSVANLSPVTTADRLQLGEQFGARAKSKRASVLNGVAVVLDR